jgi:hypothetical protein
MDKNIIKQYLSQTFLSEATKGEIKASPAIKLAGKMANDNKKINKAGVDAVGKDMKDIEKSSQKMDANGKTMATNKFNYEGKKEEDYHDQMEIMNGQEMIQYDRTPNKQFKDRAMEAIEGSTRMGNNPEWANVVAKGQGGDPEFGKKLVKSIKASEKKRTEQTRTTKMFGNDWEVIDDSSHKSYAFEGVKGKSILKENVEFDLRPINGQADELKDYTHFAIHKATNGFVTGWDYSDKMPKKPVPPKDNSNKRAVTIYKNKMMEYKEELKDAISELKSEANHYFFDDVEDIVGGNMDNFKKSDFVIVTRDGLAKRGIDLNNYNWFVGQKYGNETSNSNKTKDGEEEMKGLDSDYERDSRAQQYGINPYNENTNKNKTQIKENMKRLKFKKEFNGVGNALKLIPESYKLEGKVFEMTDGNETYKIRWEGSLTEGKAVILTAADSKMINEDIEKMKHLFNYKSHETFGLVKGKDRLDENAKFGDIWNKTKALLKEEEEEDEAPIKKRKDAYDASLDVADPEDIEKSVSKSDIEKATKDTGMISKDVDVDDEDDIEIPSNVEYKLAKSTSTGNFAIFSKVDGKITDTTPIPTDLAMSIKNGEIKIKDALDSVKSEKEMSDEELMEELMKMTENDDDMSKKNLNEENPITFLDIALPSAAFLSVLALFFGKYLKNIKIRQELEKTAKGEELTDEDKEKIRAEIANEMKIGMERKLG